MFVTKIESLQKLASNLPEATLAAANARFRDTILTAPITGTVLEIIKREGEAVRKLILSRSLSLQTRHSFVFGLRWTRVM